MYNFLKFKFKVKSDIDAFKMGHLVTNTSKFSYWYLLCVTNVEVHIFAK